MAYSGKVWVSAEVAEKIRAHGVEKYPHECCGALFGREAGGEGEEARPREIVELFPLVNRREDSPQNRFSVSSQDVLEADRTAAARGLDLIGWYHSHPDHPARPSEYDREHAWPWYSYIIVSVQSGVPGEMKSWRLQDDRERYDEETIELRAGARARFSV